MWDRDAGSTPDRAARGPSIALVVAVLLFALSGMMVGLRGPDWLLVAIGGIAAFCAGSWWAKKRMVRAGLSLSPEQHRAGRVHEAVGPVLEGLPDPVLILDPAGRIVLVNAAGRRLLPSAAPGRYISSAVRTPSVLDAIEQVRGGAPAQAVEYTVLVPFERHLQAQVIPVHLAAEAFHGPNVSSMALVIQDFTSIKRLEQMRVDFVASASHELRTPLASLGGFIETLRGHAKDDPDARERFLSIMEEQVTRMGRLINDLLSLSRIELNEHVPPADLVNIQDVISDVVDALSPLAQEDGVDMIVTGGDGCQVQGDRDELVQVFQNLVHNALKYGADGERVEISIGLTRMSAGHGTRTDADAAHARSDAAVPAQDSDAVVVRVRDFGPGIPREHISRLTERFYRVDVRQSRRRGGTGLGLAIVKHIVNRHRGCLEITSAEGDGATFSVFLPAPERRKLPQDPVRTMTLPGAPPLGPGQGRNGEGAGEMDLSPGAVRQREGAGASPLP